MSLNLNHVVLAGNLTRDPETKFLANERAVCNFGIAINRKWKDNAGNAKEETTFVDIEAWGRTAELVGQYLKKGSPVYIEGRLKLDTWEKDGQKHSKLRVSADSVQFLGGGKRESDAAEPSPQQPTRPSAPPAGDAESPPF